MPRRDDLDDARPWYAKAGFLVAAAFVAAVLVVGLGLVFAFGPNDEPDPDTSPPPATSTPTPGDSNEATSPPEMSTDAATSPGEGDEAACETPQGSEPQAALTTPPDVEWLPVGLVSTAVSAQDGPAGVNDRGFSHCYARTSAGALLAAHNFLADLRNPKEPEAHRALVDTMVASESVQAELIEYIEGDGNSSPVSVVGYRFLQTADDEHTVSLVQALPGKTGTAYVLDELTLEWLDGDWRITDSSDPTQVSEVPSGYVQWGEAADSQE